MALLFGNSATRNQSKHLVEFKAGKMTLKGNMVHPDKRKGLCYVHQTEDSLMHFCWKDRNTSVVDDDLIIFPEDVEFKRVTACTTGRVYLLKFKSNKKKLFYWMQEPKAEKDDDFCHKVNDYLNNPPAPGSARSGGSTPGGSSADHVEGDLQNLFSAMNQQQFMQLLGMGGVGGMANLSSLLGSGLGSQFLERATNQSSRSNTSNSSTTATSSSTSSSTTTATSSSAATTTSPTAVTSATTTTTTTTPPQTQTISSAAPIQLSDVQNIISGITSRSGSQETAPQAVDLSRALTAETIQPILTNEEFMQRIQALLPNVGDGSANATEELRATIQSPQFQQAFSAFSAALSSGQLGPLVHQFGMSEEVAAAAAQGDLEAFVNALQSSQRQGSDNPEKKNDDDEDEMALD